MTKRSEILKTAYRMFCEKGFEQVLLREIAAKVEISKALLQHYFTKKNDILETMLQEILEVSFLYVDQVVTTKNSIYLRLSVYANLFFHTATQQNDLHKFVVSIISDRSLLRAWIQIIYKWLRTIKNEEMGGVSERDFQIALSLAMAGGVELLLRNEELEIPVSFICEQMVTSFMRVLNNDADTIQDVIIQANKVLEPIDWAEFNEYCVEHIFWYS